MRSSTLPVKDALIPDAHDAVRRAARRLSDEQKPDGHWCAPLTADSTLESDYILLQLWLHAPEAGVWNPPTRGLVERAARAILERQLPNGGFSVYAGGPADASASVKAYTALKLAGLAEDDPRLGRARERILALGGIEAANSYTRINLSLFGLYPRERCPSVPPEIMLVPGLVYRMSAWTRAIVIALSVVDAANPCRPVPAGFRLEELLLAAAPQRPRGGGGLSWHNLFLVLDRGMKWWERYGSRAIRRRAIRAAERWMLERAEGSDGLGAIYPPMMYHIMALDVLGYAPDHAARREALRQFEGLMHDEPGGFFFEPCFSPVWDTAIAAYALGQAGSGSPAALDGAGRWLAEREIRRKGDWSVRRPATEPSGWAFEYNNPFYPDIDDTAMALLALAGTPRSEEAVRRGLAWLLDMQSRDGGWAAFDVDNDWNFLRQVPFADHNAMLDPTCPDITGRVLEALAAHSVSQAHAAVRRGVAYLVGSQQPDGSWYGRWGVAYIYGTCFALRGLAAAGESDREAHVLRAGEWLRSIQNADGGWGESCASYEKGAYVPGPSTASQTAWALLGLIAGGDSASLSVRQGIQYLLERQRPDGDWDEDRSTGTGFPGVFYLHYHLYRLYFPLLALSTFVKHNAEAPGRAG